MPGLADLIWGILAPAVIAGVVLLAGARQAGAQRSSAPRPVLGAVAFGAGYLLFHALILGVPGLPAEGRTLPLRDWVFWLVALAVALSPVRALPRSQAWSGPLYVAFFSVLIERTLRVDPPEGALGLAQAFGGVLLVYVLWSGTERFSARRPGLGVPAALLVAATGVAVTVLANASLSLAQQAAVVSAGLGAALVVTFLAPDTRLAVGAVSVAAIVLAGAVRIAVVYDLPPTVLALLCAGFAAPWLVELPGPRRALTRKTAAVLALLLAALPAGAAAALAWASRAPTEY